MKKDDLIYDLENVIEMEGEKFWRVLKNICTEYKPEPYAAPYMEALSSAKTEGFAKHIIRGVLGELS